MINRSDSHNNFGNDNAPSTFNKGQNFIRKPQATLYKNFNNMKTALFCVIDVLRNYADTGKITEGISTYDEGFVNIDDMTNLVRGRYPELDYINRNHIVELYFKDRDHKILINGEDQIKFKIVTYVQPPDTLYFGTLEGLASRMLAGGIKSHTKKYIKLYETKEQAEEFAKKFASREEDKVVTLTVNAKKAFADGMKFSTYKPGEYIIVRVDRNYIIE